MARRQIYDDVMDVALRATLKEYGFTRKTRRDYILERPDRVWIFELEMAPDPRPGFLATAAFHMPEPDATLEKYVPGTEMRRSVFYRRLDRKIRGGLDGMGYYPCHTLPYGRQRQ